MKKRNGFVSNSSSSSFVVLLPDNFDIKKHVEENWEKVEIDFYDLEDEFYEDDEQFQTLTGLEPTEENKIKHFLVKNTKDLIKGNIDFYENYNLMNILSDLLNDYVIANMDSGPDEGQIICLDKSEKKKIRKILGC